MQEVGGGVGAAQAAAALDVDRELDGIADPQGPPSIRPTWTWRSPSFFSVSVTATVTRTGADRAGVADLAAQFAIEGRLVGDDHAPPAPGAGLVDQLAALRPGPARGPRRGGSRSPGTRWGRAGRGSRTRPRSTAASPEPFQAARAASRWRAMAVSKPAVSTVTALGAERVLGEVEREAEGVVEAEGDLAGERLARAQAAGLLLEEAQAALQRAAEAGLLQAQHLGDQALGPDQLGEGLAHLGHEHRHHAPQHGLARTQELGVAHAAAHDPAQHVAAALVGRHDAVGDQEGGRRAGGRRSPCARACVGPRPWCR